MYASRPSIVLSKRPRLTFAALFIVVLLAAALAGCGVPVPAGTSAEAQPSSISTDTSPLVSSGGFSAPVPPIFMGEEVTSIEEAQSRVEFRIAVPNVVPDNYKLTWIGVSSASDTTMEYTRLVYSDGKHYIIVHQGPIEPMDISPFLEDEWLAFHYLQKITIHGHPGFGHGAITVERPVAVVEGKTITVSGQVPAYIRRWPSGLERNIWTPDDLSITLEDLIAMAESMEPAQ